jgi:hypothetical protein
MPGCHYPKDFSQGIFAILHDERDQPPTDKPNKAVLFWVVVPLVFHIGQGEQLVELCKVNVAPLEDLLPFRFIPSNPHRQRVYNYYTVLQQRSGNQSMEMLEIRPLL